MGWLSGMALLVGGAAAHRERSGTDVRRTMRMWPPGAASTTTAILMVLHRLLGAGVSARARRPSLQRTRALLSEGEVQASAPPDRTLAVCARRVSHTRYYARELRPCPELYCSFVAALRNDAAVGQGRHGLRARLRAPRLWCKLDGAFMEYTACSDVGSPLSATSILAGRDQPLRIGSRPAAPALGVRDPHS